MQRRALLATPLFIGLPAWAHHGWSSFDQTRPLYLAGKAQRVEWRTPMPNSNWNCRPKA